MNKVWTEFFLDISCQIHDIVVPNQGTKGAACCYISFQQTFDLFFI